MEKEIKYPETWKKRVGRVNAYGRKAWGEYTFIQYSGGVYRQTGDESYVNGYRNAIKDIRKLNK